MEETEAKPLEAIPEKTPLEAVILPENTPIEQEESPKPVHSEPTTAVSFKSKLANLNLADIKPFYPRSEREQRESREREQFERSLYAEVASRGSVSSIRPEERKRLRGLNTKASAWNPQQTTSADRVIRMSERDLLEDQRRMRERGGAVADAFMDRPTADSIPHRAEDSLHVSHHRYPRTYEELRSAASQRHLHLPTSPLRRSQRPSGMELLEQNLERRHDPFFERQAPPHSQSGIFRNPSNRSVRSGRERARERSEFELWSDYKKEHSSHYGYPTSRNVYPPSSFSSLERSRSGIIERERPSLQESSSSAYYSHSGHLPPSFSDYPPARGPPLRARRMTSSRISETSARFNQDLLDYDLYRYEDLCKSDPVYADPTQDNEFFMYQMLAAEENAKREKLCGTASVIPPEQVAKATAPKKETQKSRICRHFLRGHCKFGESCNFFHGAPLVHASDQLIFLGGLPSGITSDMLVQELNRAYGVEVLNKPQIFSNFSPRVALSLEDAKLLKGHGKLNIFNRQVDVRPFEDNSKSEAEKSMVFLGGLPEGIKLTELISQLRKKGIQVMNKPYLGDGYARNVQVQSEKHANDLIRKRKIFLFSSSVDVRPYVNVYGKKKDDDNGTVIPASMLPPHNVFKPSTNTEGKLAVAVPAEKPTSPVDDATPKIEEPAVADKEEQQD